jgi:O-antigen ligase
MESSSTQREIQRTSLVLFPSLLLLIILAMLGIGCLSLLDSDLVLVVGIVVPVLSISCIVMGLLARKFLKKSWYKPILGIYVVLFVLSSIDIGRVDIGGSNFPLYILGLPILGLVAIVKQVKLFRIRLPGLPLLHEMFLFGILLVPVTASVWMSRDFSSSLDSAIEIGVSILGYILFSSLIADYQFWLQLFGIYAIAMTGVLVKAIYHYHFSPLHYFRLVPSRVLHANHFAFMLEMALLPLLCLMLTSRSFKKSIVYAIGGGFLGYGLALTSSRSALITVLVGVIVFLFLSLNNLKLNRLIILFIGVILVLTILAPSVWLRVRTIWDDSAYYDPNVGYKLDPKNNSRLLIWQQYFREACISPLVGVGFGLFIFESRFETNFSAHNSYLGMLAGSGFPAFFIFLIFLAVHGLNLWRARRFLNRDDLWGNVLVASYIAILLQMLVQNFFFSYFFWVLLSFQAAALNIYAKSRVGNQAEEMISVHPHKDS